MNKSELNRELESFSHEQGADLFGVADAKNLEGAPLGHRPSDFVKNAKSVLVLAVKLVDTVIDQLPKSRREYTLNFSSANIMVNSLAFRLAKKLELKGYEAYSQSYSAIEGMQLDDPVNLMDPFSYKHAAVEAGLGVWGKNSLLVTHKYGPRVRLSAVITNATLLPTNRIVKNYCEGCSNCVDLCPVKAIGQNGELEKLRCAYYLFSLLSPLKCGMCVKACPQNKFS